MPKFQTLSTLKTKEHKGHRASELRLDDTTKEISAALMNDHGASICTWVTSPTRVRAAASRAAKASSCAPTCMARSAQRKAYC
ncbi:hypothetical protein CR64_03070 [Pseudomonas aeruginosa]|nr:hypothetical protein CR64_03070 [Pseudomonas aeruginosa]